MNDVRELRLEAQLNERVDVRWHDAPSRERVLRAIIVQQRGLNDLRVCVFRKKLAADAPVQLVIGPIGAEIWAREACWRFGRYGVEQAEDDVLNEAAVVAVRDVAS